MMDYWGHIVGVITVILLVAFVGLWIWAWLPRHRAVFNRMARLPLDRDDAPPGTREDADDDEGQAQRGEKRQ